MRKDGTEVYVSLTIAPIRDGHNNVSGLSTIARNITKQRGYQEQLASWPNMTRLPVLAIADGSNRISAVRSAAAAGTAKRRRC